MHREDAYAISEWHYEQPYTFYDFKADEEDLREFLDFDSRRRSSYYSVFDEEGELSGFFEFTANGDAVSVGLGMRPDLTGKGLGLVFLLTGLSFALEEFRPRVFTLSVAEFNKRAIKVYEKAGFRTIRHFRNRTNGGNYEFVEMVKNVTDGA